MRWAALLLALLGCSDANLYGKGLDNTAPARLALSGQVCTVDAQTAGFPVRVLFLVDRAMGPVFADFDPESSRLRALSDAVGLHAGNEAMSFAVAAFGPRAELLSDYTRNPGVLDGAIATLAVPRGCVDNVCRDYDDALSLARSVIEGDLARQVAGTRLRTQYVVVWVVGGPPDPLTDWVSATDRLREGVLALREQVNGAGALSFALHTLFLAAPDASVPDPVAELDANAALLQQLSLAGAGRAERFNTADAITLDRLGLLQLDGLLEAKNLLVTNLSVVPSAEGPLADSDLDGLSDREEALLGTDASLRDSDGDGVGDLIETLVSFDPRVPEADLTDCANLSGPPFADSDGDLLNDCEEQLVGTDASLPDTDGDGFIDWVELSRHTDYLQPDSLDDVDWDGASNGEELLAHTDPTSADANGRLSDSYRYEVTDDGLQVQPTVAAPRGTLSGLVVRGAGGDTTGGVGVLRYQASAPPSLSWQDPADDAPGPAVSVQSDGPVVLRAASDGAGVERWLDLDVSLAVLPPGPAESPLLVQRSERQCLSWTVRNIRLVETRDGVNNVFLYFGQAPLGQLERPGLFRAAHVPVQYSVAAGRLPSAPVVTVSDAEFGSIGE